jgi:hypothetical protein
MYYLSPFAGNALVLEKKHALPLDEIMLFERKGGWGRSIRGAEKAVGKLMANEATKADGMDLSQHLEYVHACRSLQPALLKTLSPERLEAVIKLLSRGGVNLATPVLLGLASKEGERVALLTRETPDTKHWKSLIEVVGPWPQGQAKEVFNPMAPRMSAIPGTQTKAASTFSKTIVRQTVVALILDGASKADGLQCGMEVLQEYLEKVDLVEVSACEAALVSDMKDMCSGILGIIGSVQTFLSKKGDVEHLEKHTGSDGSSVLGAVANAFNHSEHYKERLKALSDSRDTLAEASPIMMDLIARLGQECSIPDALHESCEHFVKYHDLLPSFAVQPWKAKVKQEALAYAKRLEVMAASADTARSEEFRATCAKATNIFHELTVAFPMDEWAHSAQAEVAAVAQSIAALGFDRAMEQAIGSATQQLDSMSKPLVPETLEKLEKVLREAQPEVHFTAKPHQEKIKECLEMYLQHDHRRTGDKWQSTLDAMKTLCSFVIGGDKKVLEARIGVCDAHAALLTSMESCQAFLQMIPEEWQSPVGALLRGRALLQDAIASPSLGWTEATRSGAAQSLHDLAAPSAMTALAEKALVEAESITKQVKEKIAAKYQSELDSCVAELSKVSGGDPELKGALWTRGRQLSEWADWGDLQEQFATTLKKLSATVLKSRIKEADSMKKSLKELREIFSDPDMVVDSELLKQIERGYLTKASGALMRTLTKGGESKEAVRAQVRAEIKAIQRELGEAFDYKNNLPKALVEEMNDVITMKRKRET